MILFVLLALFAFATTKKIGRKILLSVFSLLLLLYFVLQIGVVQNFLIGIATKKLSKELGTEVSIKHVGFSFF